MTARKISREDALVTASRSVLWALRGALKERQLSHFSTASLLLLEEALEAYETNPERGLENWKAFYLKPARSLDTVPTRE